MRRFLTVLMLLTAQVSALAGGDIYFHVANENGNYTFLNTSPIPLPTMLRNAAMLTLDKPYAHNLVQMQYYQLTITHGIVWNGEKIVQYDYAPINSDRFRHVLWLNRDRTLIIKSEIYDIENKMIYSALCLNKPFPVNQPSTAYIERVNESSFSFLGFTNINEERFDNSGLKMLFTDGLNRFSVFRSIIGPKQPKPHEEIIYGNLVFSKDVDGFTYTVVGTIPFSAMDRVINRVDAMIKEKAAIEALEKVNASAVPEEQSDETVKPPENGDDINIENKEQPSLTEDTE